MNKFLNKNSINIQKRKYLFLIIIMFIGIISGILFYFFIKNSDKSLVKEEIELFMTNLNSINKINTLFNSISSNSFYILLFWILGLSMIGCFIVIFILFFKSFVLGFGFTSIICNYGFKGILIGFFTYFPHYFLFLLLLLLIGFYSINFSIKLFRLLFLKEKINLPLYLKKYNYIFILSLFIGLVCSIFETYITPLLLNLFL